MEYLQTIPKMALAGAAVWRLMRMIHGAFDDGAGIHGQGLVRLRLEDVLGSRVMDFLYWIGIWMSAQTALWVACGLGGVLLNWLVFSGAARLMRWSKEARPTAVAKDDVSGAAASSGVLPVKAIATKDCNGAAQLCR
jgi:hypothetical protein